MAKTYTGNYTKDAAKVIRQSDRLECQVTEDGTIYICNGYLIFKMDHLEYASLVQPVTCCEAGNWRIDGAGKMPGTMDVEKIFCQNVTAAESAATMELCPMVFQADKKDIIGFYSSSADFTAIYDKSFIFSVQRGSQWKSNGNLSAAVAFARGQAFALVLPIKPRPNISRAVRAYYTDTEPANYREELEETKKKLSSAMDLIATQSAELDRLREAQPTEPHPSNPSNIQDIATRFQAMPGITATVKGAQTASPVIWLSGDTESNLEAINAAGAKWSAKRGAYYYRVA